jgi:hypothetical protein
MEQQSPGEVPGLAQFKETLGLAGRPEQQHDGAQDHEGEEYRSADLVLFGLLGEMSFKVMVAHGGGRSWGKYNHRPI